ncbi:hypothetical protein KAU88_02325 [Candidatus Bathyarchaeota archaeon]|nr:hypothetical protein [Candidatus Bathyarchaeota archaeon]
MKIKNREEIERAIRYLRLRGQKTLTSLFAALLIWLFGILVFIPLAESLNWQTRVFVSMLFFFAFSLSIVKTLPGLKELIDVFAYFLARKHSVAKGLNHENASTLFTHLLYMICSLIFYGLYSPFLTNFHPAANGIALIAVLILIFFLLLRVFPILLPKFLEWLSKS